MRKAMTSGWPWSVDDDSYRVDGIGKFVQGNTRRFSALSA